MPRSKPQEPFSFGSPLRSARRAQEIVGVLVRFGFEDVVHRTGLDQLFGSRTLRSLAAKEEVEDETFPRPVSFRKALERLGPTFIKLGQVLSTRADLLPPDWIEELSRLQDDCEQLEFEALRERLDEELEGRTDEIFHWIDREALAAASIAQVHRATLHDGTAVVIKILRPGVRQVVEADMEILARLARFVERHFQDLGFNPSDVVQEFWRELRREIDLTNEAEATDRLRRYFEQDDGILFPKVYWEATTSNVLTLEEIFGVRLSRLREEDLTPEERRSIMRNGADAVFRQCLEFGFFHADPHPGNIFALPGGRVCFIDCGMTGSIDRRTAEHLADLVSGVLFGDLDQVIRAALLLTGTDSSFARDRAFRQAVWEFVSRFQSTSLERLYIGKLLEDFFQLLRTYKVRCPANLVFLIKALSTIEGVGESVDPSFDLVGYVKPHVERLLKRRWGVRAVAERLQRGMLSYGDLAEDLPDEIRRILSQLSANRFRVNLDHRGLDRLTETVEHASRNISYALVIAALVIGSAIVTLADQAVAPGGFLGTLGLSGLLVAAALGVGMVIGNLRRRG